MIIKFHDGATLEGVKTLHFEGKTMVVDMKILGTLRFKADDVVFIKKEGDK